jgi:hypothetical protein
MYRVKAHTGSEAGRQAGRQAVNVNRWPGTAMAVNGCV